MSDSLMTDVAVLRDELTQFNGSLNTFFILWAGTLIFFMQAGFAMFEAGQVRKKNLKFALYMNVMDSAVGCLCWFAVGFAFAKGTAPGNPFIGTRFFFGGGLIRAESDPLIGAQIGTPKNLLPQWFLTLGFAGTAATIVSGALLERTRVVAHVALAASIHYWTFPLVAYWVWTDHGWLSVYNPSPLFGTSGYVDLAGSGVVHVLGGVAATVAAAFVGPRIGRFSKDGTVNPIHGFSPSLSTLGLFILWFCWWGFNVGSIGSIATQAALAAKVMVNTAIAGAAGGCTAILLKLLTKDRRDIKMILDGVLAGLVCMSACSSVIDIWASIPIAATAELVSWSMEKLYFRLRIDDPCAAGPVHLGAGAVGVLCVGLFATKEGMIQHTRRPDPPTWGLFYGGGLQQLGVQLLGLVVIAAWSCLFSTLCCALLRRFHLLRLRADEEAVGADALNFDAEECQHAGQRALPLLLGGGDVFSRLGKEGLTSVRRGAVGVGGGGLAAFNDAGGRGRPGGIGNPWGGPAGGGVPPGAAPTARVLLPTALDRPPAPRMRRSESERVNLGDAPGVTAVWRPGAVSASDSVVGPLPWESDSATQMCRLALHNVLPASASDSPVKDGSQAGLLQQVGSYNSSLSVPSAGVVSAATAKSWLVQASEELAQQSVGSVRVASFPAAANSNPRAWSELGDYESSARPGPHAIRPQLSHRTKSDGCNELSVKSITTGSARVMVIPPLLPPPIRTTPQSQPPAASGEPPSNGAPDALPDDGGVTGTSPPSVAALVDAAALAAKRREPAAAEESEDYLLGSLRDSYCMSGDQLLSLDPSGHGSNVDIRRRRSAMFESDSGDDEAADAAAGGAAAAAAVTDAADAQRAAGEDAFEFFRNAPTRRCSANDALRLPPGGRRGMRVVASSSSLQMWADADAAAPSGVAVGVDADRGEGSRGSSAASGDTISDHLLGLGDRLGERRLETLLDAVEERACPVCSASESSEAQTSSSASARASGDLAACEHCGRPRGASLDASPRLQPSTAPPVGALVHRVSLADVYFATRRAAAAQRPAAAPQSSALTALVATKPPATAEGVAPAAAPSLGPFAGTASPFIDGGSPAAARQPQRDAAAPSNDAAAPDTLCHMFVRPDERSHTRWSSTEFLAAPIDVPVKRSASSASLAAAQSAPPVGMFKVSAAPSGAASSQQLRPLYAPGQVQLTAQLRSSSTDALWDAPRAAPPAVAAPREPFSQMYKVSAQGVERVHPPSAAGLLARIPSADAVAGGGFHVIRVPASVFAAERAADSDLPSSPFDDPPLTARTDAFGRTASGASFPAASPRIHRAGASGDLGDQPPRGGRLAVKARPSEGAACSSESTSGSAAGSSAVDSSGSRRRAALTARGGAETPLSVALATALAAAERDAAGGGAAADAGGGEDSPTAESDESSELTMRGLQLSGGARRPR